MKVGHSYVLYHNLKLLYQQLYHYWMILMTLYLFYWQWSNEENQFDIDVRQRCIILTALRVWHSPDSDFHCSIFVVTLLQDQYNILGITQSWFLLRHWINLKCNRVYKYVFKYVTCGAPNMDTLFSHQVWKVVKSKARWAEGWSPDLRSPAGFCPVLPVAARPARPTAHPETNRGRDRSI